MQAVQSLQVAKEVRGLEPGGFETIALQYLVHDSQVAHVSEALCCAGHGLLDELLTAAMHQFGCPLLQILIIKAEQVASEDDFRQGWLLQMTQFG